MPVAEFDLHQSVDEPPQGVWMENVAGDRAVPPQGDPLPPASCTLPGKFNVPRSDAASPLVPFGTRMEAAGRLANKSHALHAYAHSYLQDESMMLANEQSWAHLQRQAPLGYVARKPVAIRRGGAAKKFTGAGGSHNDRCAGLN